MTDNRNRLRFDAWLREPGAYPFLLGVVTGESEAEALRIARESLPAFDETKDPAHVELRPEHSERPEPLPALPPVELPPSPMRRAQAPELSEEQVRVVLLGFLRLAFERFTTDAKLVARLRELRPDLRIGECGALDLCADLASEANRHLARARELRAEAASEVPPE